MPEVVTVIDPLAVVKHGVAEVAVPPTVKVNPVQTSLEETVKDFEPEQPLLSFAIIV